MSRIFKTLNTPRAIIVTLALFGVLDGLLFYRYRPESVKPAAPPVKSVATLPTKPAGATAPPSCFASEVVFLGHSDALDGRIYKDTTVGGLSGLAYDANRGLYYAVSDSGVESTPARFYALEASLEGGRLAEPLISDVTVLREPQGTPFTGATLDGEGITVTRQDELLVASETEPSILRFSLDGWFLGKLRVPKKFLGAPKGYAKANASFESLELSPNGRSLFTVNEQPLLGTDGEGDDQGSSKERRWVRLLRYEDQGSSEFEPSQEFLYPVEPGESVSEIAALSDNLYPMEPGESVSEIVALSENELLMLERVNRRIFRVSLDKAEAVPKEGGLATSRAVPLEKEMVVDVDDSCPMPSDGEDSFGLLEGMALGPKLPGGRRALLLQSDDNFGSEKSRMIMLAIPMRL